MINVRGWVFACAISLWLTMPAQASQVEMPADQLFSHAQSRVVGISDVSGDKNYHSDELWLLGSFLVSLIGMIIFVRLLHRQ